MVGERHGFRIRSWLDKEYEIGRRQHRNEGFPNRRNEFEVGTVGLVLRGHLIQFGLCYGTTPSTSHKLREDFAGVNFFVARVGRWDEYLAVGLRRPRINDRSRGLDRFNDKALRVWKSIVAPITPKVEHRLKWYAIRVPGADV